MLPLVPGSACCIYTEEVNSLSLGTPCHPSTPPLTSHSICLLFHCSSTLVSPLSIQVSHLRDVHLVCAPSWDVMPRTEHPPCVPASEQLSVHSICPSENLPRSGWMWFLPWHLTTCSAYWLCTALWVWIQLSNIKEQIIDTWNNLDEFPENDVEWRK